MRWTEIREQYPNQWLIVDALEAHTEEDRRKLDQITVVEVCQDGTAAFQRYRELHRQYPQREFYFVHTAREELDIRERHWLGLRRNYAANPALGASHQYEPDFLVRLQNGVTLILEIKGMETEQDRAKHQTAKRWMEAVNNWGKLGKWAFHVCKDPQTLGPELAHLAKTTSTQRRK